MTALVIGLGFVVGVLALLVAGLLRSHADILRALHELGVRVDGSEDGTRAIQFGRRDPTDGPAATVEGVPMPGPGGDTLHDIAGVSPDGAAVVAAVSGVEHRTLIAFLSSGCLTCQSFWTEFARPDLDLDTSVRLVVVTRGPDNESPAAVAERAGHRVTVVMSDAAWDDYRVPVAPYFVLADGPSGQILGEGASAAWDQVRNLMTEALADAEAAIGLRRRPGATGRRDADADDALLAAGIRPGDPRLSHENRPPAR